MNQRCSRRSSTNWATSSDNNGRRPTCEVIPEEDSCQDEVEEPRYDPKELRDAIKILSPFVRLIEDINNPYARIVAREVCKTFYRLYHPGKHPVDIHKSINWRNKCQRTTQLWTEFWLWIPGGTYKEWVSLRCVQEEEAANVTVQITNKCSDGCNRGQQQSCDGVVNDEKNTVICETPRRTYKRPKKSCQRQGTTTRSLSAGQNNPPRGPPECLNLLDTGTIQPAVLVRQLTCDTPLLPKSCPFCKCNGSTDQQNNELSRNDYVNDGLNSFDEEPLQSDGCVDDLQKCDRNQSTRADTHHQCTRVNQHHQSAGSDRHHQFDGASWNQSTEADQLPKSPSPLTVIAHTSDKLLQIDSISLLDTRSIQEQIAERKWQLERIIESASKRCFAVSSDSDIAFYSSFSSMDQANYVKTPIERQTAGYDLPYCAPGCSKDQSNYTDHPSQFEYYRRTSQSPRTPVDMDAEIIPSTDDCSFNVEYDPCSNSTNSLKEITSTVPVIANIEQIACNASMVANAFTNLSLSHVELEKKKIAFHSLTESYLHFTTKPLELDSLGTKRPNPSKILKTIDKKPKMLMPFDDSEWNDNAFKDRDFIKLLPFYECAHNHLEYISNMQREYGVNMLDDIMSTLFHIHYDMGDPRLKNEMLVEHVKLITRNTWEAFFYKSPKKMPAIPEPPLISCMVSPQHVPRLQPCQQQPCQRKQRINSQLNPPSQLSCPPEPPCSPQPSRSPLQPSCSPPQLSCPPPQPSCPPKPSAPKSRTLSRGRRPETENRDQQPKREYYVW